MLKQAISELSDHLLIANSPFFVFDRYLNESSVRQISSRSSASLSKSLSLISSKKQKYRTDLAYAYALIVALYLKRDEKSLSKATKFMIDDEWFQRILAFSIAKLRTSDPQQLGVNNISASSPYIKQHIESLPYTSQMQKADI